MSLLDYIRGNRKGKNAHRLEKESMRDPFLYEALEGFDSVDDDHMARIAAIQKSIAAKKMPQQKKKRSLWKPVAAAVAATLAIVSIQYFTEMRDSGLRAQVAPQSVIDIYIPTNYYTENIAMIAQKNTELTKNISVKFSLYRDEQEMEKEHDALAKELIKGTLASSEDSYELPSPEEDIAAIQVYVPTGVNSALKKLNINPEPLIGFEKYQQYLKQNAKQPTDYICKDIKGKVAIEFSIDDDGKPFNFEVYYSLCASHDMEAIRLIKEGSKWTPSEKRVMVKVAFE